MPSDLALLSTLNGSNYPCLELMFMVPKVFEPLKFHCNVQPRYPRLSRLTEVFLHKRDVVTRTNKTEKTESAEQD